MKLSKFNYYTKNDRGELLLFNTLYGKKSFLKIVNEYASITQDVLSGNTTISKLPKFIYDELVRYNYIISDVQDEDAQSRKIYIDFIADSQLELTIVPTETCNFRCKYCYESFSDKTMNTIIQDSIILFVKKNLNRYSSLHISWFGGEPLLAIDIIEYLTENIKNTCKYYKKPFTASITTNGFLLDIDKFKRLLKCNVVYFQITIDGTKEIHDFQRPHRSLNISTFDKIFSNLIDIKSNIKSSNFRITLRSNFSKLHLNKISEYKRTFYEYFNGDKRFQFFIRPVMDWGGECINKFKDNLINESYMDEMYNNIMYDNYKLNFIYDDFLDNACSVCEAGKKNYYVIITNGDIYKCTCNFEEQQNAKIGKLPNNGTLIIDKNLESLWLCNINQCKEDCFYSPICLKEACPAIRILKKKGSQKCPLEKRNISKILQLLDAEKNIFRNIPVLKENEQ